MSRSEMMSRIGGKDTKPEMLVRRGLHACGLRYRLHVAGMPGKPDIVLPKYRTVILIHGCFWHAHQGCKHFRIPKTRSDFWRSKLLSNRQRDTATINSLKMEGWRILIVWECATKENPVDCLIDNIVSWLQGCDPVGELSGTSGTSE